MSILDNIPLVLANRANYGTTRRAADIQFLVYHYTGNDGDNDANNAAYFRDHAVEASAHYFVDDDSITQSVPDLYVAYAVGGRLWSDVGRTGGGTMYGVVTNRNSLSIEMCDTRRDGTLQATEATMARAAALGRALMDKYQIPLERVCRHFDVTGKHCPAYLMDAGKWAQFKARLEKEDEDVTIYHWFDDMPDWARESAEKAYKKGVITADPQTNAVSIYESNLQTLVILDRLGLLD